MIEFSEMHMNQNAANFLEADTGKDQQGVEATTLTRKIAFDKGIPLSFDFASNDVQTINYTLSSILVLVLKKIFSRPLHILMSVLILYYIIVYLLLPEDIKQLNIAVTFYIHICLIFLDLITEIFNFFQIYRNDSKTNSQPADIYDVEQKCFVAASWKDIRVGHIIKIKKDEIVPADIILIETMDSNHHCYLDVSAINGIFDSFIVKKACIDTQTTSLKNIKFNEYVKGIKGMLKYEEPNSNIHSFNGRLKIESFPRASDVREENFVMRGSTIKNVKWVYGLVVYTGMETKIMQILKKDSKKVSFISKEDRNIIHKVWDYVQYMIIFTYLLLIINLSFILAYKCYIMFINKPNQLLYISSSTSDFESNSDASFEYFLSFTQFLFTFHLIIPFSWFNLITVAYYIFGKFIEWDIKVKQKAKNTVDIINSSCLHDFGQVSYILADKTGTLTSRKFVLKACSIQGKIFSFDPQDKKDENSVFRINNYNMTDLEIYQELKSNSNFSYQIREFFEYLCVCHSVKVSSHESKGNDVINNEKILGSSFAEEKSTLNTLKNLGYCVTKTKNDRISLDVNGEIRNFYVIGNNQYSEERKRMSVLVKRSRSHLDSILICKGSDLSILRLVKFENEKEMKLVTDQIKNFSSIGYRFFIFCKRTLSEDETAGYITKYKSAENYMLQREMHFDILAQEYELDMEFVGVLFFEEKINSVLRYSINKLKNSNINVWMVSGDKKENVISVAKNLNMYKPNSIIAKFSDKDGIDDLDIKMNMYLLLFLGTGGSMFRMKTRGGVDINVETSTTKSTNKELTILIHGNCFNTILNDTRLLQCFTTLLGFTTCLLAYSFTPHNKYKLCQIVKKFLTKNSKVLAIGDGLNDFMMLKEADLSVGIRSKEILQVRNSCDVIVSKFPQIVDLILVHGTLNMQRIYAIFLFNFYANLAILFPFFLQQFKITVGSSFFNVDYLTLSISIFIINFTILLVFCLDQYVDRSFIGINASIYTQNVKTKTEIILAFGKNFAFAFIDSFIIYVSYVLLTNPVNILGETMDVTVFYKSIIYTIYALIYFKLITLKLNTFNVMIVLVLIISIGGIVGLTFYDVNITTAFYQAISCLSIVLCGMFSISLCYLCEKCYYTFIFIYKPDIIHKLTLVLKKFLHDYVLFLNFEEISKAIGKIHALINVNKDKVTYQDIFKRFQKYDKTIDPVLDNMANINNDDQIAAMKIKRPFLRFFDEKMETDYLNHMSTNLVITFFYYLLTMLLFWVVDIAIESAYSDLKNQIVTKIVKIIMIFLGSILFIKPMREKFLENFSIYYYLLIFIEIIMIYSEKSDNDTKICINLIILLTFPLYFANRRFKIMIVGSVIYCLGIIPGVFLYDYDFTTILNNKNFLYTHLPLLFHRGIFIIGSIAIMIIYGYSEEYASRISFIKLSKKLLDYKKDEEIYANFVPEFVREKMKMGVRGAAAVDYETATILFCDLSEFDKLFASISPKEMIYLLDRVYNTFDQLCTIHGLQKIETVGKTYMAAGGLKECEKDVDPNLLTRHHAIRTYEMAVDMVDITSKIILENGILKIKVGIHTGKVIAAVVGKHKPQFSLIGDTINTTARMCAYSQDMCINCSENSYQHLKGIYNDFVVSVKEVKGKGRMNLYLHNPMKKHSNNYIMPETKIMNNYRESILYGRKDKINLTKKINLMGLRKQNSKAYVQPLQSPNRLKSEENLLNRQISNASNQSVFIFENSHEYEKETDNLKKSKLTKKMTKFVLEGIVKEEPLNENKLFKNSFLFLKFKDMESKIEYEIFENNKTVNSIKRSITLNIVYVFITILGLYYWTYHDAPGEIIYSFFTIKLILCLILIMITYNANKLKSNMKVYRILIILIFLLFTITIQIQLNYMDDYVLLNATMEQNFTIYTVSYSGVLFYSQCVINLGLYILIFIINIGIHSSNNYYIKYLVFEITICVIIFVFLVIRQHFATMQYLKNKSEGENLKRIEELLFNLMPQHVVQNLKEDIPVADVLYNVTVLFSDIVKFTDYSSQREPFEVVNMVSELFNEFDDACKANKVYKVHTIGDCYVVMSFTGKVPLNERNYKEEAKNVVKMGECMIETIRQVRQKVNFLELDMRIGIHTGTVIAGIIGTKVVRYDIFGSDVLIANKMESGGEPGRINVSEETRRILETDDGTNKSIFPFKFIPNKVVSVSSVNKEVMSYFIEPNYAKRDADGMDD